MDRLLLYQAYVDSLSITHSISASLMISLVRCYHLYCDCCSVCRLLLGYAKEVRPISSSPPHTSGIPHLCLESLAPLALAYRQNSPRETHDPNHNRYLQTPHLSLRRRHYRPDCPNSLVSILRNHSSRDLRYLDPRFSSLHLLRLLRIMFIVKSRWIDLLRYIRLLLGITSYRKCRLDYVIRRSIWWMVLLWSKESSWWCTQGCYL
jgi:hypothetical protein